jgi:hypothetical protein
MRSRCDPKPLLQITGVDAFTQKRQLNLTPSDDNSSGCAGDRAVFSSMPSSTSNLRCEYAHPSYLAEECRVARMSVVTLVATHIGVSRTGHAIARTVSGTVIRETSSNDAPAYLFVVEYFRVCCHPARFHR